MRLQTTSPNFNFYSIYNIFLSCHDLIVMLLSLFHSLNMNVQTVIIDGVVVVVQVAWNLLWIS